MSGNNQAMKCKDVPFYSCSCQIWPLYYYWNIQVICTACLLKPQKKDTLYPIYFDN